ncbi:SpoIIE family protein phosphatase [Cellulomonas massiliensis]|uniref:SpoIIE family protein phosphatase n=1 Tax=Cellulomonas massiliensis TaxID=1465811 RepID=UPI0002FD14A8|nr:SpoIIE family protein phosphatase [Cellulomonas massiliensis]
MTDTTFLAPDEPVDLDNCAREPIHVPGSIQPRGVLLAVTEPDLVVEHASENLPALLGTSAEEALGATLDEVLGAEAAGAIRTHLRTFGDLRSRNPLVLPVPTPDGEVEVDVVLHRTAVGERTLLVVEIEAALGPRPFSFPNTYQAVRGSVERLNGAHSLDELYAVAAEEVRTLTGFDRVMVYRFDAEYNGEVVAEARRPDLNSFLGLHYPATDIPVQARALYEKNWIRLISDVRYTPARIVPGLDAVTGEPLDLTYSVLRSVSPIHCEYLSNMGVAASMSISLLRDGRLWGLVACHHYSGPHHPPYGVRAAAEFLGSALSLRLVARSEEDELQAAIAASETLDALLTASRDADRSVADALVGRSRRRRSLLDLVPAHGVLALLGGTTTRLGPLAVDGDAEALGRWLARQDGDVVTRDALTVQEPALAAALPGVAGLLAVRLPDDQLVAWLRSEAVQDVDWGGDPHNKAIARREGDTVRLSPRKSFEKWTEVVRGRGDPWSDRERLSAEELRSGLVETLLLRGRWEVHAAREVQRALRPAALPAVAGWSIDARYEPAAAGEVGGDWYDALELPDGRLALVVGDVAGHGLPAAATMGQLRTSLRAHLLRGDSPAEALGWLDRLSRRTLPDDLTTVAVAVVEPATGAVELALAGHPRPLLLGTDGRASVLDADIDPPVGVGTGLPPTTRASVPPGGGLVLFSDGLVDSRDTRLRAGLERLAAAFGPDATVDDVLAACRDEGSVDDVTLVVLRRVG